MIVNICIGLLLVSGFTNQPSDGGIIKDVFQKITNTNNKTEDVVKQSAPICGSGALSTADEASLSPQMIFITDRPSRLVKSSNSYNNQHGSDNSDYSTNYERSASNNCSRDRNYDDKDYGYSSNDRARQTNNKQQGRVSEVANEFAFHVDNVTLQELEEHGFNRQAPVTFLMHGFTSGYPLQTWMSAIVEAYTIDRETNQAGNGGTSSSYEDSQNFRSNQERRRGGTSSNNYSNNSNKRAQALKHNLFIVNWNYAARGILYPRAVANIPIVASYVTRFINDKLLGEARMDPNRIQLIGHSLGAHLAGFIGKNTREKVGRIYGLDPAGPCFGTISGPLYPSSKRLAPSDAHEVITVQTNSALLGIDKPLGKYSIFVEGGANQPGCKGGGILKSLHTLTWDGADFDTVACSHSRAPNLLTYRHDQGDEEDDCQMMAYACKDWDSFLAGHCGVCQEQSSSNSIASGKGSHPSQPVLCRRIGLDWQYYKVGKPDSHGYSQSNQSNDYNNHRDESNGYRHNSSNNNHHHHDNSYNSHHSSSHNYNNSGYDNDDQIDRESPISSGYSSNDRRRKPNQIQRNRRQTHRNSTSSQSEQAQERRRGSNDVEAISMFLRTGDTQPYCTFHYQVILELNERFPNRGKPAMSIILQDSERTGEQSSSRRPKRRGNEQNSLSSDEFGNKFDEKTYTHLLTSFKKLKKIDHATMIFRNGLDNGHQLLKALQVNYMSHSDPKVRRRLSSLLCPVKTETDRSSDNNSSNRFYFKPCDSASAHNNDNSYGHNNQNNYNENDHNDHNNHHNQSG